MNGIRILCERRQERGSRAASRERARGRVPAVLYGAGQENVDLYLPEADVTLLVREGVRALTLEVDGKAVPVTLREVQYDTFGETVLHLDFQHALPGDAA